MEKVLYHISYNRLWKLLIDKHTLNLDFFEKLPYRTSANEQPPFFSAFSKSKTNQSDTSVFDGVSLLTQPIFTDIRSFCSYGKGRKSSK